MTRRTNARIAGVTYLFYIAVAFPAMVLMNRATSGQGSAAKLVTIAQHAMDLHIAVVLELFGALSALVLAVTLYSITREQDQDLALLAMTCRVAEGVLSLTGLPATLALIWLATGPNAPDTAAAQALAAFQLRQDAPVAATAFAVGSTIFSWLLLRGRMIPVWLGWLGVVGSALVMVALTFQLGGIPITQPVWLPVAVFEIVVAFWLIIKGVSPAQAIND
jgi:hypothetical protein